MEKPCWIQLADPVPAGFEDTRLQLHHATQLLAGFAGSQLVPMREDRHRSLCWDAGVDALTTAPHPSHPALRVELSVRAGELRIRHGIRVDSFGLDGRTIDEARSWLEEELTSTTGDETLIPEPEYEIPAHPVATGRAFDLAPESRVQLHAWYHDAAIAFSALTLATDYPHHGLRVWPHHFDIAVLFEVGTDDDGTRCTVGAGMTPGDPGRSEPYLYVTPYPYDFDTERRDLEFGSWNTEGWLGLVLEAPTLVSAGDGDQQCNRVGRWVSEAVRAAVETFGIQTEPPRPDDLRLPGWSHST